MRRGVTFMTLPLAIVIPFVFPALSIPPAESPRGDAALASSAEGTGRGASTHGVASERSTESPVRRQGSAAATIPKPGPDARRPSGSVRAVPPAPGSAGTEAPLGGSGPPNDTCEGALIIPTCGLFPKRTPPVDLTGATTTDDPVPGCQKNAIEGVWFSFMPPTTDKYTITTCQDEAP